MKFVAKRDPMALLNANFLTQLQNVLVSNLPVTREDLPTIAACLQIYLNYEDSMKTMLKSAVSQENFTKVNQVLKEM